MKEIELVIKLPEERYRRIVETYGTFPAEWREWGLAAIKNGIKLPKGHGRLIDADRVLAETDELKKSPWYNENINGSYVVRKDAVGVVEDLCVKKAPTIIEADKESEGSALNG